MRFVHLVWLGSLFYEDMMIQINQMITGQCGRDELKFKSGVYAMMDEGDPPCPQPAILR